MVFRFDEKPNSRRSSNNPASFETQYTAAGEVSAVLVRAYASNAVPYLVAQGNDILYLDNLDVQEQGYSVFTVTARWITQAQQEKEGGKGPVGSIRFSYSTTGGNFHITHSKSTVTKYPSTAKSHKQAINVRKSGQEYEIDGTDIIIPALKLSYTFSHPLGNINEQFARTIAGITGKVNSVAFRGFDPGEMLFLGSEGSDGTNAEAEATYHFACESNLQGLIIGSITGIDKQGHDLLWVESAQTTDAGKPVVAPLAVYIERVYERADFRAAFGWG